VAETFLRLRHKLIPYLYSANYRTHAQGIPLCEPMYYEYDCEDAYKAKNQYLFGSQLLVCPITAPAHKQLNLAKTDVWLPEGRWTDIFTGRIYQGNQWVTMHRDLDSIPVLAREGAIVPVYRNSDNNDLSLDQPLDIHIWRGNGSFDLYEDDGETNDCRYTITHFSIREGEGSLIFSIRPAAGNPGILPEIRSMRLIFRDIHAAQACINGESAEFHSDGICLDVTPFEETEIVLKQVVPAVNLSKERLHTELLTRVQGDVLWKNAVLNSEKKMPRFVREAIGEFERLEY
jgi:hypothetical protein